MGTSKEDIRRWLKSGIAQGATHCIVVCDTFDHEDYPHYVGPGENPRDYKPGEMQRIMEVYALHLDIESQLAEFRAFHYESAPEPTSLPVLSTAESKTSAPKKRARTKVETPMPEWATAAIAAGWKAPKGWKP